MVPAAPVLVVLVAALDLEAVANSSSNSNTSGPGSLVPTRTCMSRMFSSASLAAVQVAAVVAVVAAAHFTPRRLGRAVVLVVMMTTLKRSLNPCSKTFTLTSQTPAQSQSFGHLPPNHAPNTRELVERSQQVCFCVAVSARVLVRLKKTRGYTFS